MFFSVFSSVFLCFYAFLLIINCFFVLFLYIQFGLFGVSCWYKISDQHIRELKKTTFFNYAILSSKLSYMPGVSPTAVFR